MKPYNHLLKAGVLAGGMVFVSATHAAAISYFFDPSGGTEAGTAVQVFELLDFTGGVYVENTITGPSTFSFYQYGVADISGTDGLGAQTAFGSGPGGYDIRASYEGPGTGTIGGATGGDISFTGGVVSVFAGGFSGDTIATFDIVSGGSTVNNFGFPNGNSTLTAAATYFQPGYFFANDNGVIGADLALSDLSLNTLFGFSTTDLTALSIPGVIAAQKALLETAGFTDANGAVVFQDGNATDDNGFQTVIYAGANGQFRLTDSTAIAEPGTLALSGLAALLLGLSRRRTKQRS